jgi:hypothetical protein
MTGGLKKTTVNFGFRVTMDAIRLLPTRCLENQIYNTNLEFETKKGLHFDCIITLKQHQWQLCLKRKSSIPSHREHIEWLGKERCQNDTRVGKQLRVKQF